MILDIMFSQAFTLIFKAPDEQSSHVLRNRFWFPSLGFLQIEQSPYKIYRV